MKHLFLYSLIGILGISSCTKDEPWKEMGNATGATRATVLVEEYTGQNCINCPNAAQQIERISKTMKTPVITIGLHAAETGYSRPEMATAEASTYYNTYKLPKGIPAIVVNRIAEKDRYYSQDIATWETLLTQAANTPAEYTLGLKAALKEGKINVKTHYKRLSLTTDAPLVHLHLWVVEDVIGAQKLPTKEVNNYFHHNVFRAALNGTWGEPLTTLAEGTLERQYAVPAKVKIAGNAKVVALLTERSTGRVLEAAIAPLGKGIQPGDAVVEPKDSLSTMKDATLWFKLDDKNLFTGDTLRVTKAHRFSEDFLEMETEVAFVQPGSTHSWGDYTAEIVKLDHLDDPLCGLSQICIQQCEEAQNPSRHAVNFKLVKGFPYGEMLFQVHYKINPARADKEDTYAALVNMKKGDQVVARFRIEYHYSPQRVEKPY